MTKDKKNKKNKECPACDSILGSNNITLHKDCLDELFAKIESYDEMRSYFVKFFAATGLMTLIKEKVDDDND